MENVKTKPCQLDDQDFIQVVKHAPLVSIDLVVKNKNNEVLLGFRRNEPAKQYWFVPGGRILKNETISQAFERVAEFELNAFFDIHEASFIGVFDHIYKTNKFQDQSYGTHYVVLAYSIELSQPLNLSQDQQHDQWRWFNIDLLLHDRNVHPYTKAYFRNRTEEMIEAY